jgi:acetyltransferase-like isoleucine patch superfamily enzyme
MYDREYKMKKSLYEKQIQDRSTLRYYLGLIPRLKKFIYLSYVRFIARRNGAQIGHNSVITIELAHKANENLIIGNNTSIQTNFLDLRAPIKIGNHVIIGSGVEIITCSHNIYSPDWEFKAYGIEIEDYAWLATRVIIMPSCRKIGRGSVCGGGSVVVKNVKEMSVVSGNPAEHIKDRKQVHSSLVVESLLGGDYKQYIATRKNKQ